MKRLIRGIERKAAFLALTLAAVAAAFLGVWAYFGIPTPVWFFLVACAIPTVFLTDMIEPQGSLKLRTFVLYIALLVVEAWLVYWMSRVLANPLVALLCLGAGALLIWGTARVWRKYFVMATDNATTE